MKSMKMSTATLCLLALLSSCVYSLFPIYTEETLVFIPDLEGRWEKDGTVITFVRYTQNTVNINVGPGDGDYIVVSGDTLRDKEEVARDREEEVEHNLKKTFLKLSIEGYRMTITDQEDTYSFQARIARIGDHLFLDMFPDVSESELGSIMFNNFLPVHTFSKIQLQDGLLTITDFDLTALRDLFKSNRIRLRHENIDGDILITAQPEELQKFLKLYAGDQDVFDSPTTYKKLDS